ncbi:MAG TPA: hypothetical protein VEG36_02810 [Burkholderiales bacterium]|nr:hypothetical protein [Burkholderiales bacterium]
MIPRKLLRLIAVGLLAVLPAYLAPLSLAQVRNLPAAAKRGEIRHVQDMLVEINGKRMMLAPGAQIRNTANLLMVPTALPPGGAYVKYLLDAQGMVSRVWILTPQEAAQPDPRN